MELHDKRGAFSGIARCREQLKQGREKLDRSTTENSSANEKAGA
jgi:hypothetical protein